MYHSLVVGTACICTMLPGKLQSHNCNLKMATSNICPRIFCHKNQLLHLPHTMTAYNLHSKYDIRTCQRRFLSLSSKPNLPHHVALLSPQIMPFHLRSAFSSTLNEAGNKGGRPNSASDPDLGTYRRIMGIGGPPPPDILHHGHLSQNPPIHKQRKTIFAEKI